MTKIYLLGLALWLLPALGWAQQTISGRVTATDEPTGLPGASVQIMGASQKTLTSPDGARITSSGRGTVTAADGTYTLTLQEGDTVILVSYVGYTPRRINVAAGGLFNVILTPNVQISNEVVVVGYGTQRKSDLTGSVSTVRGEDLVKVPNQNAVQALQGKATGISVQSQSGEPGSAPTVRIRGVGTISAAGNNPLYVVDGAFMNDINAINAQDIESIELLKDASAAAIFGVRGANGVILVTTKRGKAGKPVFSFSSERGVQNLPSKIALLTGRQYAEVVGGSNNLDKEPNTDWQDLIFRENAIIQNHQFSAAGGTDKSTYYFGLGYFEQQGLVPNGNFDRISVRGNTTSKLTDWWDLGTNLTVTPTRARYAPGVTVTAYRAPSNIEPYSDTTPSRYNPVNTYGNPLAEIEYNSNNYYRGVNAVGNVFTEMKLTKGFKYRLNFGFDFGSGRNTVFVPQYFVNAPQSTPSASLNTSRNWNSNTLIDHLLYYNREFGKHSLDAFIATSSYNYYSTSINARAIQLTSDDPAAWVLNNGVSLANSSRENVSLYRSLSYFGRVNYIYNGKYSFTGTYRRDGSSLFPKSNRFGNFFSLAGAWNVSRESFMENIPVLSNLKLRASYGRLGNQVVDAAAQNTRFSLINTTTPAVFGAANLYVQGAALGSLSNPNLGWENTTQTDIGIEFGLLNNRLSFEGDYYFRETSSILASLPVAGYLGAGPGATVLYNAANLTNAGFEANLQWRDNIGEIGYRLGVLGTTVNNKVTSLGNTGQSGDFISSGNVSGSFVSRTQIGNAVGSFYGYEVAGVFQNQAEITAAPTQANVVPGDLRFVDKNGDGVIDPKDRVILGTPIPKFIFGFNGGFNFMGLDISADFQGQTGNKIYNGKEVVRPGETNYEAKYINRWTLENPSNTIPRATNNGNNYVPSNFFLQSGDFLRLRTLTISYALPTVWIQRIKMQAASIYVRGTNLKTWTKFTGYSPEIGAGNDLSAGIDNGTYPLARVLAIGTNITF